MSRRTRPDGEFGRELYRFRLLQGLTQKEASVRAGVHQVQWSLFETGVRRPEPPVFYRMIVALDLDDSLRDRWADALIGDVTREVPDEAE